MNSLLLALVLTVTLDERLADSKKAGRDLDLLTLLETVADNESPDLAKLFVKAPDQILFVRTAQLSAADAAEVAKFSGSVVVMNQLTGLTPEGSANLAKWKGEKLFLNGLKALDAKTAKGLAAWPGKMISLRGLESFPPDAVAEFKAFKGAVAIKLDKRPSPKPVTGTLREQLIAMDRAITSGDVEAVRAFLDGGGDPNINEHGTSLLIEASDFKQVAIVKLLIAAKANLEMETRDGETALAYAAKVNEFNPRANNDPKAIRETVLALLAAKANPNPPNVYQQPLALAAKVGDLELIAALLKAGAKVDATGNTGGTALLEAVNRVQAPAVAALLKAGAKPKPPKAGMGLNAFHRAFQAGPQELESYLYREKGKEDPSRVKQLKDDTLGIIQALLAAGADVNAPDDRGDTPLHLVAKMRSQDEAALVALASQLQKKGAKKGVKNQSGKTAADVAAEQKRPKLAAALK
jgi:ankyrin repeat protein